MSIAGLSPRPIRDGAAFRENPLAFLRRIDDGGDVLRFRAGIGNFFLFKSPEAIHRVLVADAELFGEGKWTIRGERVMGDCLITREGDPHRVRRRLIQPGFERARLEPKAAAISSRARALSAVWTDGTELEARTEMARLALSAAADSLFSLQLDDRSGELVPALMTMLSEIPRPGPPLRSGRRLAGAREVVDEVVRDAIADAPTSGGASAPTDDVLQLLLRGGRGEAADGLASGASELGEAAVAAELISLLIASIDTTPGTLAWCWHLLATHPEVESRLHDELDSVLDGRAPTAADLPGLAYLDQILSEVLRLYPPVHFIDRRPLHDTEVGGARLKAGSFMLLSPLFTQRDASFFDEPDAFRPERWEPGREPGRPRYSYFPFGGGPHTCIGMVLARIELGLVIATFGQRWRLVPAAAFPPDPTPNLGSFPMVVRARS